MKQTSSPKQKLKKRSKKEFHEMAPEYEQAANVEEIGDDNEDIDFFR